MLQLEKNVCLESEIEYSSLFSKIVCLESNACKFSENFHIFVPNGCWRVKIKKLNASNLGTALLRYLGINLASNTAKWAMIFTRLSSTHTMSMPAAIFLKFIPHHPPIGGGPLRRCKFEAYF